MSKDNVTPLHRGKDAPAQGTSPDLDAEDLVRQIRSIADLMACADKHALDDDTISSAALLIRDLTFTLDEALIQESNALPP